MNHEHNIHKIFILMTVVTGIFLSAQTGAINAQQIAPPANDNFANAQVIASTLPFGSLTGTVVDATREASEPVHAGSVTGRSVWYRWTPGSSIATYFTTRGSQLNTVIAVYTGSSLTNLNLRASNDNYGPGLTSTLYFYALEGVTYNIVVASAFVEISGPFQLEWGTSNLSSRSNIFTENDSSEVAVFRPTTTIWYALGFHGLTAAAFGLNGDIPAPADYDGDGTTDYAVFRPATSFWYLLNSRDGTVQYLRWGTLGDRPVPGDFNNDGYADIGMFRPSNGTWYIAPTRNGTPYQVRFGQLGDKPVQHDYDSDGETDVAVYRPSTGTWYILNSRNGNVRVETWGIAEDVPVPGEYDGDGRLDIAVWRPSNGTWYAFRSRSDTVFIYPWGTAGDIPQPINYGQNIGHSDLGIYRPSNGTWYIQSYSPVQSWVIPFGLTGDIPVTTSYIVQL